jgi:hypothetical protein
MIRPRGGNGGGKMGRNKTQRKVLFKIRREDGVSRTTNIREKSCMEGGGGTITTPEYLIQNFFCYHYY